MAKFDANQVDNTNSCIVIEEIPFEYDDEGGFCGWKTIDPVTVNVEQENENAVTVETADSGAVYNSNSDIISNMQNRSESSETEITIITYENSENENTAGDVGDEDDEVDYLPNTESDTTTDDDLEGRTLKDKRKPTKLPKHKYRGVTRRGLKYFGGGRSKGPEWEYVVRLPNNKVRCKFCNYEVSCKVERIRPHMEKCSKFMKNNSEVIENIEIDENSSVLDPHQCSNTLTAKNKRKNNDTGKSTGSETTKSSLLTVSESETKTLKSSFQNQPSKRQKTSNLDKFVIKTTKTQQHDIDLKVAEFFYSCNISFVTVENPCFLKLVSALRPGYVPPNRKQLSESLLDEVYDIYEKKMADILFEKESNHPITLMLDGWSSCKNYPILASSIHTGKSSMLLSSKDCCSDKKTAEYHVQVAEENIKFCKEKFNRDIFAVVTDNANKMKSFRKQLGEKYPNILVFGCSAHYLNILEKAVSPRTVLKHLIEIQTYMRNHHQPHGLLKEKKGLMPQIPNDTRWNSQIACVRTFNSNYLIYRDIVKDHPEVFDDNITKKIIDMNLYKNSLDLEVQLKLIGNALDKLQGDHVTLADTVLIWNELLNNKNLEPYKSDINKKFKEAIQPFHFVCFLTDPKFLETSLTNANEYEEIAEKWLTEFCEDYLQGYLFFRIKDTDIYPSSMFSESIMKAIPAHKWWLVIGAKFSSQKRNPLLIKMAKFFADLHSCPASSASLEDI